MKCETCGCSFLVCPEERDFYRSFDVDPDPCCSECSQKHRISFRNGRNLYHRICDASGEKIITNISPDKPYRVYKSDAWYGDSWDALSFGRSYDFNRTFFDQYRELQLEVPRLALLNFNGENSAYCNMTYGNKNCYLVFGGDFNQDVLYATLSMRCKDCVDCDFSNTNELCYELVDSVDCYGCRFTLDSKNCTDCAYISNCIGCSDCILCTNLAKRSYCIRNEQLTEEGYERAKALLLNGSFEQHERCLAELMELRKKRIVKYTDAICCENCTGGYLKNSKNCRSCYDVCDSEDLYDVVYADSSRDCFRASLLGAGSERCFNVMSTVRAVECRCTFGIVDAFEVLHSESVFYSKNMFGCNGLRHKQYCILNKQYSEPEYFALLERIERQMRDNGEWGRFFPRTLSCFGYNESTAFDYYPLSKKQALQEGFKWKDQESKDLAEQRIRLPERSVDADESITRDALVCGDCGKNYRIILPELSFLQQLNIALPRRCSSCRHLRRLRLRNPRRLFERTCRNCNGAVMSTYPPSRPEIVFCEDCYHRELF